MKTVITALLAAMLTTSSALSEDRFLDGFPDVPLIEGVREIVEERVVFDTPAGTVAQTVVTSNAAPTATLSNFGNALVALGWTCKQMDTLMGCDREGSKLTFRTDPESEDNTRIILRLEPVA